MSTKNISKTGLFFASILAILFAAVTTNMSVHALTATPNSSLDTEHSMHAFTTPADTNAPGERSLTPQSCAAQCQTSTNSLREFVAPHSEDEEEDIFAELGENDCYSVPTTQLEFAHTGHPPRQPKIPLYLKHCSLIL